MSSSLVHFPPFRLDPANERLWNETHEIPLRRKTFAVLRYLVEHPEQLVTKEELMDAVWPGTVVGDDALTGCVRDLRKVLGDEARTPHYIETVHGRGYRFLPTVTAPPVLSHQSSVFSSDQAGKKSPQLTTDNCELTTLLVGREADLLQLHQWLGKVLDGERQIVFVTGEPGIGKTALVDVFVSGVQRHKESRVQGPGSLNTDSRSLTPDPCLADRRDPCQGSEAGLHEDSCGKGGSYARSFFIRQRRTHCHDYL